MRLGDDEGPKEVVIPEQRYYTCLNCKFYEFKMISSGGSFGGTQMPLYSYTCQALDITGKPVSEMENSLYGFQLDGEKTPDCCPYLKAQKRNDKIDKII